MDKYHTSALLATDFADVPKDTFDGAIMKARVVEVYDGDTLTLVYPKPAEEGVRFVKAHFRMLGYDSPEMKPPRDMPGRDLHKAAAIKAREMLKVMVLDKVVWVCFTHEEKYGRLMGKIYVGPSASCPGACFSEGNCLCVNDEMVRRGLGKTYDGGKKTVFTREELNAILSVVHGL